MKHILITASVLLLMLSITTGYAQGGGNNNNGNASSAKSGNASVEDEEDEKGEDTDYHFSLFARSRFTHDRTITALGVQLARPSLGDGYSIGNSWKGIYYRNHHLEFSTAGGTIEKLAADGKTLESYTGSMWSIGAHFASPYRWGNRRYGVKGALLQPHLGVGIGAIGTGSKSMGGIYVKPGVNIELPYCLVDFSLTAGLYFLGNKDYAAGTRGLRITPQINLALDALWDVLDPEVTFQGTRTGVITSYDSRTLSTRSVDDGGGYSHTERLVETTTTKTPYSYAVYTNDIPRLSGIFLRYSYNKPKPYRDASSMFGLGYGLRSRLLVLDVYGEYGRLSSVASLRDKKATDEESAPAYTPEKDDMTGTFRTTATAYRAMVKLGFNFGGVNDIRNENTFSRFTVGLMGGYQGFSNITPADSAFSTKMTAYYAANPTYVKGAYHDATASESGFVWGPWFGLEIGNVMLHWEWPRSSQAPLFTSTNFSIQYLFPIKLIRSKLKGAGS